jgi:hypothetical protein
MLAALTQSNSNVAQCSVWGATLGYILRKILGTKPLKSTFVTISIGNAFVHSKHGGHRLSIIWVVTLLALMFDMMSYSV